MTCPVCGGPSRVRRARLYDDRYGFPGRFALHECRSCGHGFLDARFDERELEDLYGNYYPRQTEDPSKLPPLTEASGIRSWLEGDRRSAYQWVPPGVRVLDIGCGYGRTVEFHASRGCEAFGSEIDPSVRGHVEARGLKVKVGPFDAGDYEAGTFDVITLDQVYEHVVDPRSFLAGVATLLRPGGRAVISTPNAHGWGAGVFGRRWINWHVPYHLQQFSARSLALAGEQAGLTVVSRRTLTASPWLRYQWWHLFTCPREGRRSPFWDPGRVRRKRVRRARRHPMLRIVPVLDRLLVFQLVTRLFDGLGVGDNHLCILEKAADPR